MKFIKLVLAIVIGTLIAEFLEDVIEEFVKDGGN